jgi:hypothetical protein
MKPTLRHGPLAAISLLKFFCPVSEYDSVIGDLTERYQRGYGPIWYWKQVLSIIVLGNYGHAAQRPWLAPSRIPVGTGFIVVFGGFALLFTLMSDIPLMLPAIIGAPFAFAWIRLRDNRQEVPPPRQAPRAARIIGGNIPITGGIFAGLVIVALLSALLHDVPPVRALAIPGVLGGLIFSGFLYRWREAHPLELRIESLHLKGDPQRRVR